MQPQSPPMRENIDAQSARLKTRRRWKPKNRARQLDSQAFATTITAAVVARASAPRLLWREEQRGVRTHAQRVAMSQRKITRRPLHSIRAQSATRTLLRRPRTPGICCPGLRIDGPTSAGHLPTGPEPWVWPGVARRPLRGGGAQGHISTKKVCVHTFAPRARELSVTRRYV